VVRALLLDLDNTLLQNDMERFIPAYLSTLGQYMSALFQPEPFIRHLMHGTDAMCSDADPSRTNKEVFDAAFFPAIGRSRHELEPLFDDFYATRFPQFRDLTQPNPAARSLVEWAFAQGFQVAIATNPLFPLTAIEQRLEWAGVPTSDFPYHLVTSYENMHAAKPHEAYFREIAQRLGRPVGECMMVGDEWEMDIAPALAAGMLAYWIAEPDQTSPAGGATPSGQGSLTDFARWIRKVGPGT
jgi:HAD superfamily hydrolase (TIGR01549 family)